MLELNQRVINDVAERSLKWDAGPGFEPGMLRAYETGVVAALPAINCLHTIYPIVHRV